MLAGIKDAFVPDSKGVAPEYWPKRASDVAIGVIAEAGNALTATAHFVAIGVGDKNARPTYAILVNEASGVLSRMLGLWLSSIFGSAWLAARSRSMLLVVILLEQTILAAHAVLLLMYPSKFIYLELARVVIATFLEVARGPAEAALWNHEITSGEAGVRAEVNRKSSNQDRLKTICLLAFKWRAITLFQSFGVRTIWMSWCIMQSISILVRLYRLLRIAAPPVLDLARIEVALANWDRDSSCVSSFSPSDLTRGEPILRGLGDMCFGASSSWPLVLGVSLPELLQPPSSDVSELLSLHANDAYVLGLCMSGQGELRCVLKAGATALDQIRATFHARRLRSRLTGPDSVSKESSSKLVQAITESHSETQAEWHLFEATLKDAGCNLNTVLFAAGDWRLENTNSSNTDLPFREIRPTGDGTDDVQTWRLDAASGEWQVKETSVRDVAGESLRDKVRALLYRLLLPAGYPDSVAYEYMDYQIWDTLQVLCDDLRSIVLAQAALLGQGVGSDLVKPIDVVRDDMRLKFLGQVLALVVGSSFRSDRSVNDMKKWRIYNTVKQFVSVLLLMLEATDPRLRFTTRSCTTCMNSTIGVMGDGVGEALVLHLSKNSVDAAFKADVKAKEQNQDRILQICMMFVRCGILFCVGTSIYRALIVVVVLTVAHIVLNALAVKVLALKTLNAERAALVLQAWSSKADSAKLPSPASAAKAERLHPRWRSVAWPSIVFNASLQDSVIAKRAELLKLHDDDRYLLFDIVRSVEGFRIHYVLKEGAKAEDVLKVALHAHYAQQNLKLSKTMDVADAIIRAHGVCKDSWASFKKSLEDAGWKTDRALLGQGHERINLGKASKKQD